MKLHMGHIFCYEIKFICFVITNLGTFARTVNKFRGKILENKVAALMVGIFISILVQSTTTSSAIITGLVTSNCILFSNKFTQNILSTFYF